MKTKIFMMMALVTLLMGGNACTEEDKGLAPDDDKGILSPGDAPLGNGGDSVPDPEGMVRVKVYNEANQINERTIVELPEIGSFLIDRENNFMPYNSDIEFCTVGEVYGLGNVRVGPAKGWSSRIAVEEGTGYWVRHEEEYGYKYARLYVERFILSEYDAVWGAYIKYESPCIPTNAEFLAVFPDENFRAYLLKNFDADLDGSISKEEAELVRKIDCRMQEIKSLQGIELFIHLDTLYCQSNRLTSLDVSQNKELKALNCMVNNTLTSLNLGEKSMLKSLICECNQLTSLDIQGCPELEQLSCRINKLTSLDVGGCTALRTVICDQNSLTSLYATGCSSLEELNCFGNQLKLLDISGCTSLRKLSCQENKLKSLNINECIVLEDLDCRNNMLTYLDTSRNLSLTSLECSSNKLTQLDVSENRALETINCANNSLVLLEVGGCTELCQLFCWDNKLTTIDITNNTKIREMNCENNQLTTLDISKNTKLISLTCETNQLSSLDISQNKKLTFFNCLNNPGSGSIFPITAWFDNSNVPAQFSKGNYTYNGRTVSIVYSKKN